VATPMWPNRLLSPQAASASPLHKAGRTRSQERLIDDRVGRPAQRAHRNISDASQKRRRTGSGVDGSAYCRCSNVINEQASIPAPDRSVTTAGRNVRNGEPMGLSPSPVSQGRGRGSARLSLVVPLQRAETSQAGDVGSAINPVAGKRLLQSSILPSGAARPCLYPTAGDLPPIAASSSMADTCIPHHQGAFGTLMRPEGAAMCPSAGLAPSGLGAISTIPCSRC